jgi:hypothetical protein
VPKRHSNAHVEKRLSSLAAEFSRMESIVPTVCDRLAQETVAPRHYFLPAYGRWLVATATALPFGVLALCLLHRNAPPPGNRAKVAVVVTLAPSTLQLDGVTIIQRFSFLLDTRAVVAAWSCSSPRHDLSLPETPLRAPFPRENYTEISLRSGIGPDGTVYQCSLFIADPGVTPSFHPPSMTVRLPQSRFVSFGSSVKSTSPSELLDALKIAGPPGAPALSVTEVQNAMRLYNSSPRGWEERKFR